MDGTPAFLVFIAVILVMVLGVVGIWWVQSTMAERGRLANPSNDERTERIAELEAQRQRATGVIRVVAPAAAVALAVVLVIAIMS